MRLGCKLGQGYGIARPMPAGPLVEWLDSWAAPAAWIAVRRRPREDLPLLTVEMDHRRWSRPCANCA